MSHWEDTGWWEAGLNQADWWEVVSKLRSPLYWDYIRNKLSQFKILPGIHLYIVNCSISRKSKTRLYLILDLNSILKTVFYQYTSSPSNSKGPGFRNGIPDTLYRNDKPPVIILLFLLSNANRYHIPKSKANRISIVMNGCRGRDCLSRRGPPSLRNCRELVIHVIDSVPDLWWMMVRHNGNYATIHPRWRRTPLINLRSGWSAEES